MIAKLKALAARVSRLVNYGAFLLEEIRRNNSVAVHFENQNALLFGMTEVTRKLEQFEHLHGEVQKANQLMNIAALELRAGDARLEEITRRLAAIESDLASLRADLASFAQASSTR